MPTQYSSSAVFTLTTEGQAISFDYKAVLAWLGLTMSNANATRGNVRRAQIAHTFLRAQAQTTALTDSEASLLDVLNLMLGPLSVLTAENVSAYVERHAPPAIEAIFNYSAAEFSRVIGATRTS